ncbi:DNA polymerase III subunit beta [candidate division WWE3 bacterium]|nr:DNA polymerase III subunit beta [candidate division WWE3 bacterium]
MKFTCRQENLETGLSQVYKAVPNKANLPILSNVHLLAKDGRLRLSATNLDTSITTYVGVDIAKEGAITVPAKIFRDLVSNLPEGVITVTLDDHLLHVEVEKNTAKLNTVAAEEYPEIPVMGDDVEVLEMDTEVFADAVKTVVFAAASDETRPIFSGVYISFIDGVLNVVASDGFRLSEKTLTLDTPFTKTFSVVIPAKTLMEVSRLIDTDAPTKIALDDRANLVLFANKDTVVATRILDGNFPDYKRIIPTEHTLEAEVAYEDLLEAVRLADVFAQQVDSSIKVKFDSEEGLISVSSSSPESGEQTSSFQAAVDGDPLEIVLNSKYILDFLSNAGTDKIRFRTQTDLSPCVFNPLGKEGFLHIIMPRQKD